jgi:hypothetical protein
MTEQFERLINVLHEKAPQAKLAFNSQPADSDKAALRWLPTSPSQFRSDRKVRHEYKVRLYQRRHLKETFESIVPCLLNSAGPPRLRGRQQ